jgi:protoheme IX farnesyltransferase
LFKLYYRLAKPGIVYGNVMAVAAGFLLASKWHVNFGLLLAVLAGMVLVIASACVSNNYIDRDIDKKMSRTKKRALVSGEIAGRSALIFGSMLGIAGFLILGLYSNGLTLATAIVGWFFYVFIYGYAKRHSVHGTLVGAIPGATPPVAGYLAVTDHLDGGALSLFLILVCWQMPHFYAIAMFRRDDYKAASLPVWPVKNGMRSTKLQILLYVSLFTVAVSLLGVLGYAGSGFLVVMVLLGLYWLWRAAQGFRAKDDVKWARKMFGSSLIVLLVLCVMLSTNPA